jgi:hypothetical protein
LSSSACKEAKVFHNCQTSRVENHFLHYIEISKVAMCMTQDKIENKILCTKVAMCMAQDKIENKILGTKIAICITQDEI